MKEKMFKVVSHNHDGDIRMLDFASFAEAVDYVRHLIKTATWPNSHLYGQHYTIYYRELKVATIYPEGARGLEGLP